MRECSTRPGKPVRTPSRLAGWPTETNRTRKSLNVLVERRLDSLMRLLVVLLRDTQVGDGGVELGFGRSKPPDEGVEAPDQLPELGVVGSYGVQESRRLLRSTSITC